jgi:hypothetical protein
MIQAESGISLRPAFHEESLYSSNLLPNSKLGHVKLLCHKKDETLPNSPFGVVRDLSNGFEPVGKKKILHKAISSLCEGINRCQVPSVNIRDSLEYLKKAWQVETFKILDGREFHFTINGNRQKFGKNDLNSIDPKNIKKLLAILEKDCNEFNHREYVLFYESFSEICLKIYVDKRYGYTAAGASNKPLHSLANEKSGLGKLDQSLVDFKLLDHIRLYGLLCKALDEVRVIMEGLNNDKNSKVYDAVCKCLMLKLSNYQELKRGVEQ